MKVADKSNDIVAIPQWLDILTGKGATITIDAQRASHAFRRGDCQREIAAKIIEKKVKPACPGPRCGVARNLLRGAPDPASLRVKRKLAAWDDDDTAGLVTQK